VETPTSVTLKVLHGIIQAVMGWFDQHLWEFTIAGQRYGTPMDKDLGMAPRLDAAKVRLRDVLKPRKTIIDYLYDFGDSWELRLIVTGIRQGETGIEYPCYTGGEWNAPPEDCGGIPGFYATLEAIADPGNPNHAEAIEWFEDYDPKAIDELGLKYALSRIAKRRNAATSRLAKKNSDPAK
jgi:Plasmid pRiA4b ORF-3-like protein